MIEKDKKRFQLALAAMAEAYQKECPITLQKTYWAVIQDEMTIEQFEAACVRLMKTSQWFPKPSEIITAGKPSDTDAALIAWDELCRTIDREGSYRSVLFTDGVLNATLTACGGWQYACGIKQAEFESFFRNRFLETYAAFKRQGKTSSETHIGITDQANGRRPREVRLIGELVAGIVGVKRIESEVA